MEWKHIVIISSSIIKGKKNVNYVIIQDKSEGAPTPVSPMGMTLLAPPVLSSLVYGSCVGGHCLNN